MTRLLKISVWIPSLIAGWYFLGRYFAPDACLDLGGSFDYVNWVCSHSTDHQHLEVPFYNFGSFWIFVVCIVGAIAALPLMKRRGQ
jgi:hypothetical protein